MDDAICFNDADGLHMVATELRRRITCPYYAHIGRDKLEKDALAAEKEYRDFVGITKPTLSDIYQQLTDIQAQLLEISKTEITA